MNLFENAFRKNNWLFDTMFTKGEPFRPHLHRRPVNTHRQLLRIDRLLGYAATSACERSGLTH